jgi:hypothetical protein
MKNTGRSSIEDEDTEAAKSYQTTISMTQAYFVIMEGLIVRSSDGKLLQPWKEPTFSGTIAYFSAAGVSIESVSLEDIEDKSKSDSFSRLLACFQISWLFVQLIGRATQGLPISTLELFTVSNAACAVVSYVIWWNKPKDVGRPVILQSTFSHQEIQDRKSSYGRPPALEYPKRFSYVHWLVSIVAILLASLSILGWSFPFVTYAEKLTWRILSLLLPVLAIIYLFLLKKDCRIGNRLGRTLTDRIGTSFTTLYAIIRLYFIVEVFTGLRSSPPGLYTSVNWSQYFPHL